jgi:hypothetical protein
MIPMEQLIARCSRVFEEKTDVLCAVFHVGETGDLISDFIGFDFIDFRFKF